MSVKNSKIVFFVCLSLFSLLATGVGAQSLLGDANNDGTVSIVDALLVARYVAGYSVTIVTSQADVNCDGVINISDALRMAQYSVGLISKFSCITPTPTPIGSYVPGDVIVGFYDSVTFEQADNLVKSYNLTWKPTFSDIIMVWVEVQGDPATAIAALTASPIVGWAEVRGYSAGETGKTYVIVQTHGTVAEIESLINGIAGLKIMEYVFSPKYGVVKVPSGTERNWINTFTQQSIVKYAQLNYIMTTN